MARKYQKFNKADIGISVNEPLSDIRKIALVSGGKTQKILKLLTNIHLKNSSDQIFLLSYAFGEGKHYQPSKHLPSMPHATGAAYRSLHTECCLVVDRSFTISSVPHHFLGFSKGNPQNTKYKWIAYKFLLRIITIEKRKCA